MFNVMTKIMPKAPKTTTKKAVVVGKPKLQTKVVSIHIKGGKKYK